MESRILFVIDVFLPRLDGAEHMHCTTNMFADGTLWARQLNHVEADFAVVDASGQTLDRCAVSAFSRSLIACLGGLSSVSSASKLVTNTVL